MKTVIIALETFALGAIAGVFFTQVVHLTNPEVREMTDDQSKYFKQF